MKEQGANRLSSLGIKPLLNVVAFMSKNVIFVMTFQFCQQYKMDEIVNNLLQAGDKFMPEMHLKQPGFTHSPCGLFTKNKKRIEKFIQTGGLSNIY